MSQYRPDPQKMYVAEHATGWFVYDAHGVYDGPYTFRDALFIIANVRNKREHDE